MKLSSTTITSLLCWTSSSKEIKRHTKLDLFPEDDPEQIAFTISEYPLLDNNNRPYIAFLNVEVMHDGSKFCDVIIDCRRRTAYFQFSTKLT